MAKDDDHLGKKTAGYTPADAERLGVVLDERQPDSEATIVTASPNVKPELLPRGLKARLYEGDLSSDPRKIRDVRGVVADPTPHAAPTPSPAPPWAAPSPGAPAPPAAPAPWASPAPPLAAPHRAPEQPITTRTVTRKAPGTIVISTTQLVLAVLVFSLVVVAAAGLVGYSLGRSNH